MRKSGNSLKTVFTNGIIASNPVLKLVLGTCPTLAVSVSAFGALGMGIAVTFVLVCSNIMVSLLRKVIPDKVRIPAFILIIATFVTLLQMLLQKFVPALYEVLGIYLPLIVVNCIVLGRAEAYASKNGVFDSFIDALGMGVGYTLAIMLMALFRELIGTGAFSFGAIFTFIPAFSVQIIPKGYEISLFQNPVGAFIVFALILAVISFIKNRKAELKANLAKQEKARKASEMAAQAGGNK